MSFNWVLLAAIVFIFSALRRHLRRQKKELSRQSSRLEEFTAENKKMQRRSDREANQ